MQSITSLKCPGSLDDGILTLEDGRTIDLAKVEKAMKFIANSPMPSSNDGEHELLMAARDEARAVLDDLAQAIG